MSKIVKSVLVAAALAAGALHSFTANAAPTDRTAAQGQYSGNQSNRSFWDEQQRNGS